MTSSSADTPGSGSGRPSSCLSARSPTGSYGSNVSVAPNRAARFLVAAIRVYKSFISPILPKSCRFSPSCSEYACLAVEKYGLFKGSVLALGRILRCNPFSRGGYDPLT